MSFGNAILLLGAGASEPAGIPLIRNITRGFLQNPIHLTSDLIEP